MDIVQATDLLRDAMLVTLVIVGPILGIGMVVGLIISLVQAITQIQEQTLSFAIKLIVTSLVILATATWLGGELYRYTQRVFASIGLL